MTINYVRTYEKSVGDHPTRTETQLKTPLWSINQNYINEIDLPENKKQSNTASLQWGLKTPSNKMPVKIYACKPTFV